MWLFFSFKVKSLITIYHYLKNNYAYYADYKNNKTEKKYISKKYTFMFDYIVLLLVKS